MIVVCAGVMNFDDRKYARWLQLELKICQWRKPACLRVYHIVLRKLSLGQRGYDQTALILRGDLCPRMGNKHGLRLDSI